jgi:hypothetical protein
MLFIIKYMSKALHRTEKEKPISRGGGNPFDREPNPLTDATPYKYDMVLFFFYCGLIGVLFAYTNWYVCLALCLAYIKGKEYLILRAFGFDEELTCMDYFFLYDNYKNRANILAVGVYQKFDLEKVKKQFIEKALKFPRLKQRLVRKFGSYFWKTIPDVEFNQMLDQLVINMNDKHITTEEELAGFVSHES